MGQVVSSGLTNIKYFFENGQVERLDLKTLKQLQKVWKPIAQDHFWLLGSKFHRNEGWFKTFAKHCRREVGLCIFLCNYIFVTKQIYSSH